MEKSNPAKEKSFDFAIRIVKVCRRIQEEEREYILTKQLLRSGTSVGANTEEAIGSFSDKDFHYRFSIAYKEARESHYWIRILRESELMKKDEFDDLIIRIEELQKIIGSILKTMRNKTINK